MDWEGSGIFSCGAKTAAQVSRRQAVSSILHQYVFGQDSPYWEDAAKPSLIDSEHLLLSSLMLGVAGLYPFVLVPTPLFKLNSFLPFLESVPFIQ